MTRSIVYLRIQLCIEKGITEISQRLDSQTDLTKKERQELSELFLELVALNADVIGKKSPQKWPEMVRIFELKYS
jgi:hypothetical protein